MSDGREPDGTDQLEIGQLGHDISFVTRILRMHLQERNAPFFEKHGVAGGEIALLNLIGLNPGISQKEISRIVVLRKSALTKLVNQMERDDLICRRKEGGDMRLNALHLTEHGAEKLARMQADMAAWQSGHLAALSPAETAILFELLWRLIDSYGGMGLLNTHPRP